MSFDSSIQKSMRQLTNYYAEYQNIYLTNPDSVKLLSFITYFDDNDLWGLTSFILMGFLNTSRYL